MIIEIQTWIQIFGNHPSYPIPSLYPEKRIKSIYLNYNDPFPPKKKPHKTSKNKNKNKQKPHHPTNQQTHEPTYPLPLKTPQIIQKQIKGSFMYVIMIKLLQKISIDRHLIRMRLQKKNQWCTNIAPIDSKIDVVKNSANIFDWQESSKIHETNPHQTLLIKEVVCRGSMQ